MLKLQFLDGSRPALWIVDERISIGRDKTNSLVINDEGVSLFHAELRQEDNKLFVWDSGSVNGTFVNGAKISGKHELQAGDIVRFHLIELQITDPAKGNVPTPPQASAESAETSASPLWQAKALTGPLSGKMFPIEGPTVIGRDPSCDIVVPGSHVSRRHAELSIRSGKLWMKDLGSSNGSFVNGARIEETALKNGDEVKFDAMTFKVIGPASVESDAIAFQEEADKTQFRQPTLGSKPAVPVTPQPVINQPVIEKPVEKPIVKPTEAPIQKQATTPEVKPAPPKAHSQAAAKAPSTSNIGPVVLITLLVLAMVAAFFIFK